MTIPADDQVLLSLPSANRDEGTFDRADSIIPYRAPNRHIAFGGGCSHRCLGAGYYARWRWGAVCLEEFLAVVPSFRLSDVALTTWKAGPIRGPKSVTLVLDGGA